MKVMHRIGMDLIREKKAAILAEASAGVEKKDVQGRDLLTLLMKANMATDIPESQRLSDEDVLAQVPTYVSVLLYCFMSKLTDIFGTRTPS